MVLWGDGSPTREFLHVRDAARGRQATGVIADNEANLGARDISFSRNTVQSTSCETA